MVLKAAQKAPEEYPGLAVRVADYSAYSTQMNKGTQSAIVSRHEQILAA
jgi:Pyruvate-formate lyase